MRPGWAATDGRTTRPAAAASLLVGGPREARFLRQFISTICTTLLWHLLGITRVLRTGPCGVARLGRMDDPRISSPPLPPGRGVGRAAGRAGRPLPPPLPLSCLGAGRAGGSGGPPGLSPSPLPPLNNSQHPTRPIPTSHSPTSFNPESPLWDPSPAQSARFHLFCGHRLDPPPRG